MTNIQRNTKVTLHTLNIRDINQKLSLKKLPIIYLTIFIGPQTFLFISRESQTNKIWEQAFHT